MKTINLTNHFEGHVILWAKNWYHNSKNGEQLSLSRLYEVHNEWTGMPDGHKMFTCEILRLVINASYLINTNPEEHLDVLLREAAQKNKRLTSYHVNVEDSISVEDLIKAHAIAISGTAVNNSVIKVEFPKLMPELVKRYGLKGRE